jgi:hypothetical protein
VTIDELWRRLNEECGHAGIAPPFMGPPDAEPLPAKKPDDDTSTPKWRVCTNYMRLNEVTKVLQMPQGDIRPKQQALSGHRWILMFDFTAGFYAVEIAEESRPLREAGGGSREREQVDKQVYWWFQVENMHGKAHLSMDVATESEVADTEGSTATDSPL